MNSKHCCCCGKQLDSPFILMKPIGRTKKIPYCNNCANKLLIPIVDIAQFGVYFEELPDNLKLAVSEYYNAKDFSVKFFNELVDKFNNDWNNSVDEYYANFGYELKLMEEALLNNA